MEDLKYPVGQFRLDNEPDTQKREEWIRTIEDLPGRLKSALEGISQAKLDSPYRPEGWTIRQLVHHIADSHLNAFCRFRLVLTEDHPTIRTYLQDGWGDLEDSKNAPIELSILIIEGLHGRWSILLKSMTDCDFQAEFNHPEWGTLNLESLLQIYAWHSRHHLAHIQNALEA